MLTLEQFRHVVPEAVWYHSNADQQRQAIDMAVTEAEAYLARVYNLPLIDPGVSIPIQVAHIAAWHLAVSVNVIPEAAAQSGIYLRAKHAREFLQSVANRELVLWDVQDTPSEQTIEPRGTGRAFAGVRK